MLQPWSAAGREVVSHAVLGNMGDALVCALQDLYLAPMSVRESQERGFNFQISPRDHFLLRTQGIRPQKKAPTNGLPVGKRTGVSAEDIREKWHSTAQVRNMKKKARLMTHKAGIGNTNGMDEPLPDDVKAARLQVEGKLQSTSSTSMKRMGGHH
jgi:hypothetical protein